MVNWSADAATVRVPATSANLGPGFDALGLALTLYDEVEARVTGSGLAIEVSGEGEETAGAGEDHLIVRAMRAAFEAIGAQPPGLALRCTNRIPHSRGLGSSAAAIVAGVAAARALAAGDAAAGPVADADAAPGGLPDDAVYALAARLEGHPDNVAACLAGGLTIAWSADGRPHLARLSPLSEIVPVTCVARDSLATDEARRALPRTVSHADAAANAGRSALLVAALTSGPAVLLDATQDWLHQPYRASVMPATADLVSRLRAAGIPAVVSGAGPSVLAFLAGEYFPGLDVLGSIVSETGNAWHISPLNVDRHGASVQLGPPTAKSGYAPQRVWSGRGHGRVRTGTAEPPEPQDRSLPSATHGELSREYRGLSWC
ncbi:MAG: homoserine kinase [Micromonosporaceae bacterium]